MAKLAVLLLFALIAVATASTYTTVVTTTMADDEEKQSCQKEVQQMRMRSCMEYMRSSSPYAVANPRGFGEEQLQECCQELRSVSKPCRCEATRHMMRQMQQEYGMEEQMQEMRQMAEMLPQRCQMQSPRQCRIRAVYY